MEFKLDEEEIVGKRIGGPGRLKNCKCQGTEEYGGQKRVTIG